MADVSSEFRALVDEMWEFKLRDDPLYATHVGDHRFDDRLPASTEADFEKRLQTFRRFREACSALDGGRLPPADRLNFEILGRLLDNWVGLLGFRTYRMPVSKSGGFHLVFADLPLHMPLLTPRDFENYVSRLRAFRRFAGDHVEVMRSGLKSGHVRPRVTLEGLEAQLRAHVVDEPAQSPLFAPLGEFPPQVPPGERDRLAQEGLDAIRSSVVPGYDELLRFLREEYVPKARAGIAAVDLPDGGPYYAFCIRLHTTLDLPPEKIHDTGMSEVNRIRLEMEAVIRKTGFRGTFREFVEFLRKEPRFYATSPDELMKVTAHVLKRIDGELPRVFRKLPRMSYGIRTIPSERAPHTTTAYYERPAGDGTKAGFYYVNTYALESRPLYEIEALSLHEAVPGHHLQLALQQELPDVPGFRRFGTFTAFVEGWALYAERLGLEMGFFQDPYSDFARLSYEMWRACRLVVDTGMHALGWSRQGAIDFMAENTSSTLLNIENEVDRYIAWPGQALAYKMGELKIRELRAKAEEALKDRFDVREFHDVVLQNGAVPLDVLEALVLGWLAQRGAG